MKNFEKLSRAEMKNVLGGVATYKCTFSTTSGTRTISISGANGNAVQCLADAICWGQSTCTNVNCAGSGGC